MASRPLVAVLLSVAVIAIALLAGLAALRGAPEPDNDTIVVVVETEGLKSLYELIACPSAEHRYVVLAGGGDPHFVQLTPSQARLVREASVVVVVPDSPAGRAAAELAVESRAQVVEVLKLDLKWAYIDGVRVHHAPWYDPANAARLLEELAGAEASAAPWCRDYVETRLSEAVALLEELASEGGVLGGATVVADLPFNVYVATWLGASEVILLKAAQEAEPPPSARLRAEEALRAGAIALVTVDMAGNPVSPAGEWLLRAAEDAGAAVIRVPAPWLPINVIDALADVYRQAARVGG